MLSTMYSKITIYLATLAKIGSGMYGALSGSTLAYVYVLAVCLIFIKFWWRIMEHQKKGEQIEGFLKNMRFFGSDLAIAVLIVSGGVIPSTIASVTPHPWPNFEKLGHATAEIGDELWVQTQKYFSYQVAGGIGDFASRAAAYNGDPANTNKINAKLVGSAFTQSQSDVKGARDQVAALEQTKQDRGRAGLAWTTGDEASLQSRRSEYKIKLQKFTDSGTAFAQSQGALSDWQAANDKRTKETIGNANVALDVLGDTSVVQGGWFVAKLAKLGFNTGVAAASTVPTAWDIFTNVGYYACMLPAMLGLIAGLVLLFKAAIGAAQTGLKLEILRNVGFGLAAVFAPLFFMTFLFSKTEQFGWKLINWMFSAFLGLYGLQYIIGVAGPTTTSLLKSMLVDIQINTGAAFAKEASWPLFWNSAQVGLWAVGVGMAAGFMVDLMKSGINAGTSLLNGNFNAN